MAEKWIQHIGDDQQVYGIAKHVSAMAGGAESGKDDKDKRYYWTVHPKPNACDKCKAMAGLKYASEPQRPHPNCKCEIKKHYIGIDIMGTLEGYKAHDAHSFATGQKVTVEVRNIGSFVAGADIQADDADWRSTGWIAPGLSVTVSFTKFGEVPLPWKIYLEYNAGDNSTLQYFIRG
jgi:hypothetical protein